ncbi:MAG: hypothetical protein JWM28_1323, partial [Chitinophagaceae bacterium]|nr:hypothetical protein [Chitinophagaceae bacterium]
MCWRVVGKKRLVHPGNNRVLYNNKSSGKKE